MDILETSSVADGVDRALDPRHLSHQRIVGWIVFACIGVGSLIGLGALWLAADDFPRWAPLTGAFLWLAGMAVLAWLTHGWPEIEHRHTSYKVDQQGIEIRQGVYWRVAMHVPRSRVQHTDVSQGPLERRYGLGTLVVYTAGTDHAKVDLSGLDYGLALQIRDHLLPREPSDAV